MTAKPDTAAATPPVDLDDHVPNLPAERKLLLRLSVYRVGKGPGLMMSMHLENFEDSPRNEVEGVLALALNDLSDRLAALAATPAQGDQAPDGSALPKAEAEPKRLRVDNAPREGYA